jgi:histidinol-phosphate aminotransferase
MKIRNPTKTQGVLFMKPIQDYFVPWLDGLEMYVSSQVELAWRDPELHRMMHNENPYEPSPKVLETIIKYAKMGNRYPDQGLVLRSKIAELNGLDGPENVLLGNGSCEIVDMIFGSLLEVGQEVIQHTPCYNIYELRCHVLGGKLVSVPMIYKDRQLLFDPEGIMNAITAKTKVIVIAHPNNPSGNFMDAASFVKIAETGIPFIIDEAYVEYSGLEKSHVQLTRKYQNVIIARTFSKAYGLAGLRVGYALGDKEVIKRFSATRIPWNVGTIALWAALAAIEDTEGLQERVEFNNSEIKFIEDALSDIPGLTIFHSHANYILFDGGEAGKDGREMVDYAREKGLLFSAQSEMYDSKGFFRFSLGSKAENRMAIRVIRDFFSR